jgi:hypothetical protein
MFRGREGNGSSTLRRLKANAYATIDSGAVFVGARTARLFTTLISNSQPELMLRSESATDGSLVELLRTYVDHICGPPRLGTESDPRGGRVA